MVISINSSQYFPGIIGFNDNYHHERMKIVTKVNRIYLITLVWGVIAALIKFLIGGHRVGMPIVVSIILDVIVLGILLFAGRAAKQQGARPVGVGAIAGLIYGIVSGWPSLLIHLTRAQLLASLHARHVNPTLAIGTLLKAANSPAAHIASWAASAGVGVIMGLIVGAIGGLTTKNPSAPADV